MYNGVMNALQQLMKNEYMQQVDVDYAKFHQNIAMTHYPINGVRIPKLRALAKKYGDDLTILDDYDFTTYEDVMLYGMILFCKKREKSLWYHHYDILNDHIDSWVYTDSIYKGYKWFEPCYFQDHQNDLKGNAPFRVRSYLNIALVASKYIDLDLYSMLTDVKCDDYYVQMMVAWCLQILMVQDMVKTIAYMKDHPFSSTIVKMTISKCRDSYGLTKDDKAYIKQELSHVSQ